ncbi:helix-turn-helix domain-containing protein [Bartonella sp. B12(2025)]
MLTSFGKILRKLRIDRSERLFDMAQKLGVSSAFLSSVEIGKKSAPARMVEKIIELYALDQDTASLLRKADDACRTSFTIRPSDSLSREVAGMFVRNFNRFSQHDLKKFKALIEKLGEKRCAL